MKRIALLVVLLFGTTLLNAQGVELNGEISAADLTAAREQLRVKGLLAQTLKEVAEGPGIGQTSIHGLSSALIPPPRAG